MTPHNYEIVDCDTFCEVIFFYISPKNLLGDFFDSLAINPLFSHHQKMFVFDFHISTRLIISIELFKLSSSKYPHLSSPIKATLAILIDTLVLIQYSSIETEAILK